MVCVNTDCLSLRSVCVNFLDFLQYQVSSIEGSFFSMAGWTYKKDVFGPVLFYMSVFIEMFVIINWTSANNATKFAFLSNESFNF